MSIVNNKEQAQKISQKIYNHFTEKYPALFPSLNVSQEAITKILIAKSDFSKANVQKIINILEQKIKSKMYSSNVNKALNVDKHTLDVNSNITQQKYLENFNPIIDKKDYSNTEQSYKDQFIRVSEDFPLKQREQAIKMISPETIDKEFILVIDSKDRDYDLYSSPNNYVIHLSPSDSTSSGYIDRGFNNIKSIELLDVILIDSSSETGATDNGTTFPYLLLEVEELGGQFEGTNNEISKSFAILKNATVTNGFKYYDLLANSSSKTLIKTFNPNISLSKLTIRFRTPDGTIFNFGEANNSKTSTVNQIAFRIVLSQKNLATRFIDKSTF